MISSWVGPPGIPGLACRAGLTLALLHQGQGRVVVARLAVLGCFGGRSSCGLTWGGKQEYNHEGSSVDDTTRFIKYELTP